MTQLGKVKYITEADKSRCFICNHLIKDKTPDEGFMLYDVAIHQDCHDNMADFQRIQRIQRNGGMKGFVPALTHIPNAQVRPAATQPAKPDELKESLGWAEDVRESAERQIAEVASHIPKRTMHRISHLRDSKIEKLSDRQYELIQMWNGVGAMTSRFPGSAVDYISINAAMDGLSKLPGKQDHVNDWWLFHSDTRNSHKMQINFSSIKPGFHRAFTESGFLLNDALRLALRNLLADIPSPTLVYVLLGNIERAKTAKDRMPVTLSDVVSISNELELNRAVVLNEQRKRYSVPEIRDMIIRDGTEKLVEDCGLLQCDADFERVVSEYGDRAKRCRKCPNWFTVESDKVEFDTLYHTCPGCTVTDRPVLPPHTPEERKTNAPASANVQVALF